MGKCDPNWPCVEEMTHLLLGEIPMEFIRLHPQDSEHDTHLVRQLLAAEEDDDALFACPLAQSDEQRRPLGFFLRTDAHELLDEPASGAPLRVHEELHGPVERHAHESVDVVCHCC